MRVAAFDRDPTALSRGDLEADRSTTSLSPLLHTSEPTGASMTDRRMPRPLLPTFSSLRTATWILPLALACLAPAARAADPKPGPPLSIRRAPGPITIDGDLSDAGWQGADSVVTWFETRVGDNVEPQVRNRAYLAYDEKYFYAAFVFDDPNPTGIRAPLGDHDAVSSTTDYGGVIVDSRNDAKSARMFLANARGVQYDAVSNDATGEDNAPDFYFDSIGKITATGWTLEMRIPFSSLRYDDQSDQTWGLLLYRNYPRDRRYQFFSARLPRDVNCFICNSSKLTGLSALPHGSHLVIAPYAAASQSAAPENGVLGNPLKNEDADSEFGGDLKWNPSAGLSIDGTVNPDFSQIESDVAQITANERFALFFPEKRPFFLEGVDLFSTPMTAVYTRTITQPTAGLRATGRIGNNSYTVLGTQDEGGGSVILPGPEGSGAADQDFVSDVGIARVKHDMGQSFVSALFTARNIHGGGNNLVFGPDFQWRPSPTNNFTGQLLYSTSETPNRPDLTPEWDGRSLSDGAGLLYWSHGTPTVDWFAQYQQLGDDFRADNGFIAQVGYREGYLEGGYTWRPKDAFLNRIRLFGVTWTDWATEDGEILNRRYSTGVGMDGALNSFTRIEANYDEIRVGTEMFQRFRPRVYFECVPGRFFNFFSIDVNAGEEIDFANAREGTGATLLNQIILRPSPHLELRGNASVRWINVDEPGASGRVFIAQVERLRATWSFNARSFVRLIGQYVDTRRDPTLYTFPVSGKDAGFGATALFAYKVNWQTVVYAGYGDDRQYTAATDQLEPNVRNFFAKVSYAWQR